MEDVRIVPKKKQNKVDGLLLMLVPNNINLLLAG
jgi:hypothetical protein